MSEYEVCSFCGERKPDVVLRVDSYAWEINDDETERLMCNECASERKDAI